MLFRSLAAQASYNVTQHLNRGLINILERGATYIAKLIQDIVIYQKENPFAYNFLISALGKYNAAVIESMDEMSTSQFGIKLEVAPTDVEQQFALQALQQAAQKGEIKTSDLLIIAPMIVKNYKLASRIISIRAKRNEAMAVQNQQSQLQMQQQMESAMSQIKLMVAQIQVDGMKQKANIEGLWQSVVAEMKVKGQISGETLKGEREVAAAQQQQIADAISQSSQQAHEKQMQQQQPISV